MKLALATIAFAASAQAFAPTASYGASSALKMSTETSEEKVSSFCEKDVFSIRICTENRQNFGGVHHQFNL